MLKTPTLHQNNESKSEKFYPDQIKLVLIAQMHYGSVLENLPICSECNQPIKRSPPPKICKSCHQIIRDDPNEDRPESESSGSSDESEFVDQDDFSEGSINKNSPVRK